MIQFSNVAKTYHDRTALSSVSFAIERGEMAFLTGSSGAGKSTLFKLLTKEYESYEGDIYFNTTRLKDISKKDYFNYLAVVLQETELFNASMKDNITITNYGQENNLALLKLSKNNLQTVGFVDSNKVKLGQRVFVIGQIAATENTGETNQNNWFTNEGIITEITNGIIKTNIVERPVVAGGPLFNSAGELVGLNVVDKNGKVSAISVDKIQALLGL